jgi:predicted nucleotide-binding protein
MNNVAIALAKLAGILKAVQAVLDASRRDQYSTRPQQNFLPSDVRQYFEQAATQVEILREEMKPLFGDFPQIQTEPTVKMATYSTEPMNFDRTQVEFLARTIEQLFEIRAHSELASPEVGATEPRVFISHGRASDWREVQTYIERDVGIMTLELEQEPNLGRTVLQKLEQEASKCTSAVIVMTGDDKDVEGNVRMRENVLHEIGYFQAKFGLSAVCLLHEEGTSTPSNIHGLVYIPFPPKYVRATFGHLARELRSFYRTHSSR